MGMSLKEIAGALESAGQSSVAEQAIPRMPPEDDIRPTLKDIETVGQETGAPEREIKARDFSDNILSKPGRVVPAQDGDREIE